MSITTTAIKAIEKRLPKVIDARTHGLIDYCDAAFFLGMAFVYRRKNRPAALAALITGSFVLVESLMTDYPLGAADFIPFETHGRLDAGFAASSYGIPKLFGFEGTRASAIFKANAFVAGAVVGLTDFDSQHARDRKQA